MEGFVRQPVRIRLLTTCCEQCGNGQEVQYVPAEIRALMEDTTPTYREAERLLDEWETEHLTDCKQVPALLTAV